MLEEQTDSDSDDENNIIRAVNRLMEHIDRIGLNFDNEENPKYLLARLKEERDLNQIDRIMDALENILRTTLKKCKT